jgi:hypothetical protein
LERNCYSYFVEDFFYVVIGFENFFDKQDFDIYELQELFDEQIFDCVFKFQEYLDNQDFYEYQCRTGRDPESLWSVWWDGLDRSDGLCHWDYLYFC